MVLAVGVFFWKKSQPSEHISSTEGLLHIEEASENTNTPAKLSHLASLPDWKMLERFQSVITREDFLQRLTSIYTKNGGYEQWLTINADHALVNHRDGTFKLQFANTAQTPPGALWNWKSKDALPRPQDAPLMGCHIALDPGHIGGAYAEVEERSLKYGDCPPIEEGAMTLLTAQYLRPLLEAKGAQVTLVREKNEPTTHLRPKDFKSGRPQKSAEKLFYRTAEIRARANLLNKTIQPDFTICLHYNATGSPIPLSGQDFHILVNGAYHPSELTHEDERLQMLQKLLSGAIVEEIPLARAIAQSFATSADLPPYEYPPDHPFSVRQEKYIFSRNLLANRLYQCPVIFIEPYTMNSTEFIERHRAGDYDGLKKFDGKMRPSIYREYAQAVADGITTYYTSE